MSEFGFKTYALMVSVVLWGVLLGGVVYAHVVYFPVYLSNLPDSSVVVNGQYGLNEGTFWMLIHPVLTLSLVVSLIANWRIAGRRNLIAASLVFYVLIQIISWLYFIPELVEFRASPQSTLSEAEWLVLSQRWQHLSWLRGASLFVFSVPLLFALARPADRNGNS